ncbi:MAG: SDR family oxidoreductase [Puniceicoccaceae bacterium]
MIRPIRQKPARKVIVFGATGLVGSACVEAAIRRGYRVQAVGGQNHPQFPDAEKCLTVEATNSEAVERYVLEEWPDAVINAAAVSNPQDVDRNPEIAERVNVGFPAQLALLTRHLGAKLVHFSTDMVFDGQTGNYQSTAMPSPVNAYGRTKLAAEEGILEGNPFDPVVLRITIVTGSSPGGSRSVHEKMLASIYEKKQLELFTDELRQPVSASNVAAVAVELLDRPELHGIFHWAGSDRLSRYEMGCRILEHFNLDPRDWILPRLRADNPAFANRPGDLTLDLHPLVGKLLTRPPSFAEQLQEMKPPAKLYRWLRSLASG